MVTDGSCAEGEEPNDLQELCPGQKHKKVTGAAKVAIDTKWFHGRKQEVLSRWAAKLLTAAVDRLFSAHGRTA